MRIPWTRVILIGFIVLICVVFGVLSMYGDGLVRLQKVNRLFDEVYIVENFQGMTEILEFTTVHHGDDVWEFTEAEGELPESFSFGDDTVNIEEYLERTGTLGMVVVRDGAIVHEQYALGSTDATQHISWSVAKSFTSALVGIAVDEGHIESIMDPVTKYVPSLEASGYDGVPIKHVLEMSSGVKFDEDYADFDSDINRMGRLLAFNTSIEDFVLSLENELESGTVNRYVSMDTQVLGLLLREATGQSVTSYLEEKIWKPMGAEADWYWNVDVNEMELTFGFLNAVLRDYARFGMLYLNLGKRGDEQIVPEQWVKDSIVPDGEHLEPSDDLTDAEGLGYAYQWWIPAQSDGDYLAIGVYNQFIYVNPKLNVVIAKNSANHRYLEEDYISEPMHIEMFRAIAQHVAGATE